MQARIQRSSAFPRRCRPLVSVCYRRCEETQPRKSALIKIPRLCVAQGRHAQTPGLIQTCTLLQHVEDGQERITATQTGRPQVFSVASDGGAGPRHPGPVAPPGRRLLLKVPGVEDHPSLTVSGTRTGSGLNKRLRVKGRRDRSRLTCGYLSGCHGNSLSTWLMQNRRPGGPAGGSLFLNNISNRQPP